MASKSQPIEDLLKELGATPISEEGLALLAKAEQEAAELPLPAEWYERFGS